jgi:hypothetical protein
MIIKNIIQDVRVIFNQISKVPGSATLFAQGISNETPKSLRAIARLQSVTDGLGT